MSKANSRRYKLSIELSAPDEQDVRAKPYVKMTRGFADQLKQRFAAGIDELIINPPPFGTPRQPWVGSMEVFLADKTHAWEMHKWVREKVQPKLSEAFSQLSVDNDGKTIAHARWVSLNSDWYDVEQGSDYTSPPNKYPVLCKSCGWPDLEATPDPFLVDKTLSKAGKKDLLSANNGTFVVSSRLRELLSSLAPDQLKFGSVQIRGNKKKESGFHWMRPVHAIGEYVQQERNGPKCRACGKPRDIVTDAVGFQQMRGLLVESFGKPQWNIALIGKNPTYLLGESFKADAVQHDVAASGGLFAVLWNSGFKGLKWPEEGPYISRRPAEDSWEPTRRFGDRFNGAKDRILRHRND